MDFDQTCIDTLLGRGKSLLDFDNLDFIFSHISTSKCQGHHFIITANISLFQTLSFEQVNGF